jgi:hypothetical protein
MAELRLGKDDFKVNDERLKDVYEHIEKESTVVSGVTCPGAFDI